MRENEVNRSVGERSEEMSKPSECKMNYLGLIQGVINRMASSSVTIKGFAATIFAGVLAIVISSENEYQYMAILIAAFAIAIAFFFDWYYFYQEKQYRLLYDEVRSGSHQCDFNMSTPKFDQIKRRSALKSFSLWTYYGLLEIILVATLFNLIR